MAIRVLATGCLWAMLSLGRVWAASGVAVESKTVAGDETGVTVGIYIENDVPVVAIVIPLEIRSIDSGAFIAHSLALNVQGRLVPWEKGTSFKVIRFLGRPLAKTVRASCTIDSGGGSWAAADTAADFVSPDALLYACVGVRPYTIAAGDDGKPGEGTPSLLLTFDVTGAAGRFVIDTTCIPPANHLVYVGEQPPFDQKEIVPSYFRKGIIQIRGR